MTNFDKVSCDHVPTVVHCVCCFQESGLKKDLEEKDKATSSELGLLKEKMDSLSIEKEELARQLGEASGRLEDREEVERVTESVEAMERQVEVGQD